MLKRLGIFYLVSVFLALGFLVNAHNAVHHYHHLDAVGQAHFYQIDQSVCDLWDNLKTQTAVSTTPTYLALAARGFVQTLPLIKQKVTQEHFSYFNSRAPPLKS